MSLDYKDSFKILDSFWKDIVAGSKDAPPSNFVTWKSLPSLQRSLQRAIILNGTIEGHLGMASFVSKNLFPPCGQIICSNNASHNFTVFFWDTLLDASTATMRIVLTPKLISANSFSLSSWLPLFVSSGTMTNPLQRAQSDHPPQALPDKWECKGWLDRQPLHCSLLKSTLKAPCRGAVHVMPPTYYGDSLDAPGRRVH